VGVSIAAFTVLAALGATACSGSTASPLGAPTGGTDDHEVCGWITDLAHTGDDLARAPVADPTRFDAAFAHAVASYLATLDRIADHVSNPLQHQVELLRSAVAQHKFADAEDARAPLDDWAAQHCS